MTEPRRFLRDEDEDLATLLRSAREDEPSEADRRAVAAAIGLGAAGAGVAALGATKLGTSAIAKIGLGLLLAFSVGVATGVRVERARTPHPIATPSVAAPVLASAPASAIAPIPEPPPSPSTVESAPVAIVPRPVVPVSSSAPATAASLIAQETLLLARAKSAIAKHGYPEAIAALDAYDVVAPSGVLYQEARALRVQALAEQGQRLRALDLGRAFLEQFPKSPHAKRVRAIVDALEEH
jgi:hypothetical protein